MATVGFAQRTSDPYPEPIPATDRVITVKFVEFATIPDFVGPRLLHAVAVKQSSSSALRVS